MATTYMTAEGYKKLVQDLNDMENVQRPAISKLIAEARDKGDLSENAEYDAAKEAQGMLEMKIAELKDRPRRGVRERPACALLRLVGPRERLVRNCE